MTDTYWVSRSIISENPGVLRILFREIIRKFQRRQRIIQTKRFFVPMYDFLKSVQDHIRFSRVTRRQVNVTDAVSSDDDISQWRHGCVKYMILHLNSKISYMLIDVYIDRCVPFLNKRMTISTVSGDIAINQNKMIAITTRGEVSASSEYFCSLLVVPYSGILNFRSTTVIKKLFTQKYCTHLEFSCPFLSFLQSWIKKTAPWSLAKFHQIFRITSSSGDHVLSLVCRATTLQRLWSHFAIYLQMKSLDEVMMENILAKLFFVFSNFSKKWRNAHRIMNRSVFFQYDWPSHHQNHDEIL